MSDIYRFLADHGIAYEKFDHPPVYTVEDVNRLVPSLPAARTKNLFLRDHKGKRHFLLVVGDEKQVDLKALSSVIGSSRLSLGSPKRLQEHLGIDPGAVSILAVINDPKQTVEVLIDKDLWASDAFQCHPLVNTSTLVVSKENTKRLLAATGHALHVVEIPSRS